MTTNPITTIREAFDTRRWDASGWFTVGQSLSRIILPLLSALEQQMLAKDAEIAALRAALTVHHKQALRDHDGVGYIYSDSLRLATEKALSQLADTAQEVG